MAIERRPNIIVTGGTEGIGRHLVQALEPDANLAICARNAPKIIGREFLSLPVDISDRVTARQFMQDSIEILGGIDVLVLNAAVTGIASVGETDQERIERCQYVRKINFLSQIAVTRAAMPLLKENNGMIVFMTSGVVKAPAPPPGAEGYTETKKAMELYMKRIACENPDVLVTMISPGRVDTRMHREIAAAGIEGTSAMHQQWIDGGILRDPSLVAQVMQHIITTRSVFNPQTGAYDVPLISGDVVEITDEMIQAAQI